MSQRVYESEDIIRNVRPDLEGPLRYSLASAFYIGAETVSYLGDVRRLNAQRFLDRQSMIVVDCLVPTQSAPSRSIKKARTRLSESEVESEAIFL